MSTTKTRLLISIFFCLSATLNAQSFEENSEPTLTIKGNLLPLFADSEDLVESKQIRIVLPTSEVPNVVIVKSRFISGGKIHSTNCVGDLGQDDFLSQLNRESMRKFMMLIRRGEIKDSSYDSGLDLISDPESGVIEEEDVETLSQVRGNEIDSILKNYTAHFVSNADEETQARVMEEARKIFSGTISENDEYTLTIGDGYKITVDGMFDFWGKVDFYCRGNSVWLDPETKPTFKKWLFSTEPTRLPIIDGEAYELSKTLGNPSQGVVKSVRQLSRERLDKAWAEKRPQYYSDERWSKLGSRWKRYEYHRIMREDLVKSGVDNFIGSAIPSSGLEGLADAFASLYATKKIREWVANSKYEIPGDISRGREVVLGSYTAGPDSLGSVNGTAKWMFVDSYERFDSSVDTFANQAIHLKLPTLHIDNKSLNDSRGRRLTLNQIECTFGPIARSARSVVKKPTCATQLFTTRLDFINKSELPPGALSDGPLLFDE